LNEFALPRAIVDFERRSFVAWNVRFLEETGCSEEDIKSADAEELLTLGDSWYPIPDGDEGKKAEIVSCTAKRHSGASPASGYVVRAHGKIGYVMGGFGFANYAIRRGADCGSGRGTRSNHQSLS
jgi:hypothetical protein